MDVLVVDNYDSFTYNLVQYLGELGAEVEVVRNDRAEVGELLERGAYGGAVGWLSYHGQLDTCICIRTVVVKDGVAHVQAGGGTVADARPDYEYEESRAKARGVVRAIEMAAEQPVWP